MAVPRSSEVVVAAEQVGRAAAPVPYAEHTVAARVVPDADVVAGDVVATLALRPASADGSWTLVPAGAVADLVVGLDGDELVAVRADAPGAGPLNLASSPTADRAARHGDRTVIGDRDDFERALDEWRVVTAAAARRHRRTGDGHGASPTSRSATSSVGRSARSRRCSTGSPTCPATSTAPGCWRTRRRGPGRPRSRRASTSTATTITDFAVLAAMAFVFAADVAAIATDRSLHYHGGYGFSEEYDIQLYYRRARGWPLLLGDPAHEALPLADLLFGAAAVGR